MKILELICNKIKCFVGKHEWSEWKAFDFPTGQLWSAYKRHCKRCGKQQSTY